MSTTVSPQLVFLARSVAASYTCLGLLATFRPVLGAKFFGVYPEAPFTTDKAALDRQASNAEASMFEASSEKPPSHEQAAAISTHLIACRDLTIGTALWWLDREGKYHEMGIVILSSMILWATDVAWVWRLKGIKAGLLLETGAVSLAFIGYKLLNV